MPAIDATANASTAVTPINASITSTRQYFENLDTTTSTIPDFSMLKLLMIDSSLVVTN